jgi:hypothetical protein
VDPVAESVQRARKAFARRDWPAAYKAFMQAQTRGSLDPDDLTKLADAAWWLGRVDDSVTAGGEAYRRYLEAGLPRPAAMAALGVAVNLLGRGNNAQGEDWVGRSYGLLAHEPEGVEHGYLGFLAQVLAPLDTLGSADERACKELIGSARHIQELGRVHGDHSLVALGMLGEGRALVKAGQVPEGTALLDRVMAVLSSDLRKKATELVGRYPDPRSALLPLLYLMQAEEGYVSREGMQEAAEILGLSAERRTLDFPNRMLTHSIETRHACSFSLRLLYRPCLSGLPHHFRSASNSSMRIGLPLL